MGKLDKSKLIKKTKLIHRDGKTFFATYWVNPHTGEVDRESNVKEDSPISYAGTHDEVSTGDEIMFYDKKSGKYVSAIVKKVKLDKKYPEGVLIVSTADDPEISITLKSAKPVKKVKKEEEGDEIKIEHDKNITDTFDLSSKVVLGGSSGVRMYNSPRGKYTVKTAHKGELEQLKNEILTDGIYRMFGFFAPMGKLEKFEGNDVKVAPFVDGMKALNAIKDKKEEVYKEIRKGFVLDALLGNWDVIGSNSDNILVDTGKGRDGEIKVMRVDNGGSMFFRARGGKKEFNEEVRELKTFLNTSINPVTAKVYEGVTEEEIKKQVKEILDRRKELIDYVVKHEDSKNKVSDALNKRLDWLKNNILEEKSTPPEPKYDYDRFKYSSAATAEYFKNGWDEMIVEGNPEIKDTVKKNILRFEIKNSKKYEEFAKKNGITVEEYKKRAQARIEELIGKSDFFRATDIKVLDKILNEDKRFKSQFESYTSHGSYSPDSRAATENILFGFKNDVKHDVENRPIYGYFTDSENGVINEEGKNPPPDFTSYYGKIKIKIKREVAMRKATITSCDSLGSDMVSVFAAKPHFTMLKDDILNFKETKKGLLSYGGSYTEAQYHNKLTVDDIESIHFSLDNYKDKDVAMKEMNKMVEIARKTDIPIIFY